jgi:SAM-dependent methyltransferase
MNEPELNDHENLWGYAKRLRFVRHTIADSFPGRSPEDIRILDLGCGNGTQLALPLIHDGFDLTGIDTDERSLARARELAADTCNANFICGELENLRIETRFNVVILSEVLEHLMEPEQLLASAVDSLDKDGVMVVTVPNGYGEFEMDSWVFRGLNLQRVVDALARNQKEVIAGTDNESGHVQFFTSRRLQRLFAVCDLEIIRVATGSFLAGPIVGHTLARSQKFIRWNARITDRLPFSWASSWYFALRRKQHVGAAV